MMSVNARRAAAGAVAAVCLAVAAAGSEPAAAQEAYPTRPVEFVDLPAGVFRLQRQLRENAGATTEHLRELSFAPDPADRATLEEEHALELRTRDRERKLLKKIDGALARIEDGSYGFCEETGEPIGLQRLIARPTATLSIEAQERREMKQKLYGE